MPGLLFRESNPHAEVGTTYTVPDAFRLSADNTNTYTAKFSVLHPIGNATGTGSPSPRVFSG